MAGAANGGAGGVELYQRLVLDHGRHPRNLGPLPRETHSAHGDNPFCGDRWRVSLILDGDLVRDVRYEGAGCAISTAAASMMSEAVRDRTRAEVATLWRAFEALIRVGADGAPSEVSAAAALGELAAFAGVRRYPVRVKCARLPWQTLLAALSSGGDGATVSTE
jgi:nitrogen fixation NifU-like protein